MKCEYQPACPGCPRYGVPSLAPERVEQLMELARRFRADFAPELVVQSTGLGSRYRTRLSVRGDKGRLGIGIFERGSHRLVAIPRCGVHHPNIASFLSRLTRLVNDENVEGYDERGHSGELRAVQIAVEPSTGRLQVVLLLKRDLSSSRPSTELLRCAEKLRDDEQIQGLFWGALPKKDNSLFADLYEKVFGEDFLVDECGGARLFYPPGAFGQANPVLHEQVARRIQGMMGAPTRVVEYYAGVGSLGLGLVVAGHRVTFNEVGEGSLEGLRQGWAHLGGGKTLPLAAGPAGQHAHLYQLDDTVLVDPPRKGLDKELLSRFIEEPPARIIYLSCGIDALLRESEALARAGRLSLRHLSGWAYFPFTDHIETLLVLEREDVR